MLYLFSLNLFFIPKWLGTSAKPLLIKLHTLHAQPERAVRGCGRAHKTAEDPHVHWYHETHARTHAHKLTRREGVGAQAGKDRKTKS